MAGCFGQVFERNRILDIILLFGILGWIMEKKVLLVIPAYNEEANILKTYNSILEYNKEHNTNFDVIVINDGSKDNTEMILNNNNIPHIIIFLEINGRCANKKTLGPFFPITFQIIYETISLIQATRQNTSFFKSKATRATCQKCYHIIPPVFH